MGRVPIAPPPSMFEYLTPPVGETIWERLEYVGLLEEVCYLSWALMYEKPRSFLVRPLCLLLVDPYVNSQQLLQCHVACLLPCFTITPVDSNSLEL